MRKALKVRNRPKVLPRRGELPHAKPIATERYSAVTDSGVGISRDGLARLFQPFSQIDSGLARQFEGTGLGLALTKKIIEFQGGRIGVQSDPGKGSVFTVVLPVMTGEGKAA